MKERYFPSGETAGRMAPAAARTKVHHPDVVAAVAVGGVGDPLAVGRVARLPLPGGTAQKQLRLAPFDGHAIDVAEDVEDDGAAVGRHVAAHPGALVRVELDRGRRA